MSRLLALISLVIPVLIGCAHTRSSIQEPAVKASSVSDSDKDSISDSDDKCPLAAGLAKYNGCPTAPDTDKDGINDEEDKCPDAVGVARYGGCPVQDTDNDGINDDEDKCPGEAGPARYGGCPNEDSDKDGVNDDEDKCPNEIGLASNNGCPFKMDEKKISLDITRIYFENRMAVLSKKEMISLNEIVKLLEANPGMYLSLEGHADSTENDDINKKLSQKRAAVVLQYLISQDISADRLSAKGFGSSQPVAVNKTAKGRAQNRRVDLKFSE